MEERKKVVRTSDLPQSPTVFPEMPVARILFDGSLRIVHWTEDAEGLFGWKEEEVLGKTPSEFGFIHPDDRERVAAVIESFSTRKSQKNVTRNRNLHKDGRVVFCEWHNAISKTPDGRLEGILSFGLDITERELELQNLVAEREKFHQLANTIPQMAWITDEMGAIQWYNDRWYKYTGTTFEDVEGWSWVTLHHPDHVNRVVAGFKRAIENGEAWEDTFPLRGKDGGYCWFLSRARPLLDRDGRVRGWFGTNTDITRERETAALLVRERRNFELIAESMPVLVWIADRDGRVEYYNDRAGLYDGIHKGDAGNWVWKPALHPEDVERTALAWARAVESGLLYECEHRVKMIDGAYRWHVSRAWPVADERGETRWYGTATDIHVVKDAEQRIRQEESRLRRVIDSMSAFVGELDLDGVLVEANESAIQAAGVLRSDVIGRKFWDCHWWAYDEAVVCRLKNAFERARAGEVVRYDETIRVADDGRMDIDFMLSPVVDGETGLVSHIIPSAVDITARKLAERALAEREERFRGTFDNAAVGIAHVSGSGNWLRVNNRLCEILGFSREELSGMTFQDITHPDDLAVDLTLAGRLGSGEIGHYQIEKRYFHKDGHVVWANLTGSRAEIPYGGEPYYIAIIEDITERKKLQARLAEENERKNQFLATLSHELRNPLAPVSNAFALLEMGGLSDEQRQKLVASGKRSADHLVRLVEDLLDITRITRGKIDLKKERCNVVDALMEAIDETRPGMERRRQDFRQTGCETEIFVDGDLSRLRQVFSNLLSNAAKYTPEGGAIEVRCVRRDGRVEVTVEDNGPGVPDNWIDEIFEMFVQIEDPLKRLDAGLGIGLALVKQLVHLHAGDVIAENRKTGGMRFTVTLPCYQGV